LSLGLRGGGTDKASERLSHGHHNPVTCVGAKSGTVGRVELV